MAGHQGEQGARTEEGARTDPPESDVEKDPAEARTREEGGVPDPSKPDQGSTTGTTTSESFVGRAAGQDTGYAEETGAERRAGR